jgi:hypothetical protein
VIPSTDTSPVVGHDVVILVRDRSTFYREEKRHWRGSAASCRRKGMLVRGAVRVISITPVTLTQWERSYGVRIKGRGKF